MRLHRRLIEEINLRRWKSCPKRRCARHIQQLVTQYIVVERLALNAQELNEFVSEILDEMTGLGPIEPLLKDPTINDILINGHECVYRRARRPARAEPCRFKDEAHLLRIVNKIVSAVGRRVDESQPLCDARLLDGSRVNVAVRPIARRRPAGLDPQVLQEAVQPEQAGRDRRHPPADGGVLAAAVKARITTIISGGTGSGKTTMLNALSAFISERSA